MVPLPPLPELSPHEEHFLTWMPVHIAQQSPKVCEPLPLIPRHLIEQGTLPMDHLIMGKHENEILAKGINQSEGQVILMVFPEDGVSTEVLEHVVHPAQIPFEREP